MITKWGKMLMQRLWGQLINVGNNLDFIIASDGTVKLNNFSGTPTTSQWPSLSSSYNYVYFGKSRTPNYENIYRLQDQISTGLNITKTLEKIDNKLIYTIGITNVSSEDIEINEVGYYVSAYMGTTYNQLGGGSSYNILFDRTILPDTLTIPPTESATVTYTIELPMATDIKIVNGVTIKPLAYNDIDNFYDVITAIRNNIITAEDTGWNIGDNIRFPYTVPNGAERYATMVLTSFDEYNESGNILQFDFYTGLYYGTYASSNDNRFYNLCNWETTYKELVFNSLPDKIKTLCLTANVDYIGSDNSMTTLTSKLPIRSSHELTDTDDTVGVPIDWYSYMGVRAKFSGTNTETFLTLNGYWTRSIRSGSVKTV